MSRAITHQSLSRDVSADILLHSPASTSNSGRVRIDIKYVDASLSDDDLATVRPSRDPQQQPMDRLDAALAQLDMLATSYGQSSLVREKRVREQRLCSQMSGLNIRSEGLDDVSSLSLALPSVARSSPFGYARLKRSNVKTQASSSPRTPQSTGMSASAQFDPYFYCPDLKTHHAAPFRRRVVQPRTELSSPSRRLRLCLSLPSLHIPTLSMAPVDTPVPVLLPMSGKFKPCVFFNPLQFRFPNYSSDLSSSSEILSSVDIPAHTAVVSNYAKVMEPAVPSTSNCASFANPATTADSAAVVTSAAVFPLECHLELGNETADSAKFNHIVAGDEVNCEYEMK